MEFDLKSVQKKAKNGVLTPREKEELAIKLRKEKYTYKEIAEILNLNWWQVQYIVIPRRR
jgi:DNA-binding CsgD family transcriptional regulator